MRMLKRASRSLLRGMDPLVAHFAMQLARRAFSVGTSEAFSRLLRNSKIYHRDPDHSVTDTKRNSRTSKTCLNFRFGPSTPINWSLLSMKSSG